MVPPECGVNGDKLSFDRIFSMTSVRCTLPTVPAEVLTLPKVRLLPRNEGSQKTAIKNTDNINTPVVKKENRRRRRCEANLDDFDAASQFLRNHFHANSSRSLEIISEDSDDEFSMVRERKMMRKTKTFACLSSLDHTNNNNNNATHAKAQSWSCTDTQDFPSRTKQELDNDEDEWGFYSDDIEDGPLNCSSPTSNPWEPSELRYLKASSINADFIQGTVQ